MTIWYVDSAATGAGTGASWENAWTTLGSAFTGVTTVGDVVYVASTHSESLTASVTYTVNAVHTKQRPLLVCSVNKTSGAAESGALVGAQTTSYAITLTGANDTGIVVFGLTLRLPGTISTNISICGASRSVNRFIDCRFLITNSHSGCRLILHSSGSSAASLCVFENCAFEFVNAGQRIRPLTGMFRFVNCTIGGSAPSTAVFEANGGNSSIIASGCNFSSATNVLVATTTTWGVADITLERCQLGASFTLASGALIAHTVTLLDCSDADTQGILCSADLRGELRTDTGIICTDNISDGRSWKIVTSANASQISPFVSPWISAYRSGSELLTPYLEILRSGSETPLTDAEVWAEWAYKGTSGSTLATLGNDGAAILATPTNQTASSKSAGDWTGEDAASWFGTIGPASAITIAEAGDLTFRIYVGAPSTTVYVDPQIRGLT